MKTIKIRVYSASDVGLVRKVNEDNLGEAATPNGYLCAVCDGMGGHAGGETASSIAVDCLIRYLSKEAYPDTRQALTDALEFANMQIIGTATEHPELTGMGTTACVLLARETEVWTAHAGDSRIYLYTAREKRLNRLTKDHSFVQGLVEQGVISETEAETHPNKNRILKALGVNETLNPTVCRQPVHPAKDDIFLICSDGLSGMVSDKQIEEVLAEQTIMAQKETALMSLAKSAGGTDNITFQIVQVCESPYRKSVFENKNSAQPVNRTHSRIRYTAMAAMAAAIVAGILFGIFFNKTFRNDSQKKESAMPTDSIQQIQCDSSRCLRDTLVKQPDGQDTVNSEQ
jgi:serine/threonine protein phosphatase PrpC